MELTQTQAFTTRQARADWFTGTVWMEELSRDAVPGGVVIGRVTFTPGARTAWHTHPLGQVLYVLQGNGRAQEEGGPIIEMRAGDVVRFPAGKRHWHGAAPESLMVHLAVQQTDGERNVTWMEQVSDAQYAGG